MASSTIKDKISSVFRMHGLILQRDSTKLLVETLQSVAEDEHNEWLNKVIDTLHRQNLSSAVIGVSDAMKAVASCRDDVDDLGTDKILSIVSAFSVPKFRYDHDRKKFVPNDSQTLSLFGNPKSKTSLFLDRYTIVHQRLMRHNIFRPALGGIQPRDQQHFDLKPIEFLLGTVSGIEEVIVLGMLTQLKEGSYYLEDPTGHVKMDLTNTKFHTGLFTENCFVLAEGSYEDGVLHAKALGFPPPEPSFVTRATFGNVNFFGGSSATCANSMVKLKAYEEANQNASFVFLADVWLDDIKVMSKLRQLFIGFSSFPPTCFVFMGNFSSLQQDNNQPKVTRGMSESFSKLADLIHDFPSVVSSSKFIFVPGPLDPGLSGILPRPPIPSCITEPFRRRIVDAEFVTNPCRIRYCTREIVIFREDLLNKMCRNCVHFPNEGDVATHLSKTLVSQSHLYPLPLHIAPVYWEYDHAMRIYPLPDLLVLGDRYDPFKVVHSDCNIINPGSFSRNGYMFKVYVPALHQVEDSQIKDE